MKRYALFLLAGVIIVLNAPECFGVLANAWHIPDNSGDLNLHMRDPEFEIGPSTIITVYSGLQKFNNSFGTANQTGGTLYYKGLSQAIWSSTNLQFYTNG